MRPTHIHLLDRHRPPPSLPPSAPPSVRPSLHVPSGLVFIHGKKASDYERYELVMRVCRGGREGAGTGGEGMVIEAGVKIVWEPMRPYIQVSYTVAPSKAHLQGLFEVGGGNRLISRGRHIKKGFHFTHLRECVCP